MRILLVDDSEDARDITEAMLVSANFRDIVKAASAWDAFKILDLGQTTSEAPSIDIAKVRSSLNLLDGIDADAVELRHNAKNDVLRAVKSGAGTQMQHFEVSVHRLPLGRQAPSQEQAS